MNYRQLGTSGLRISEIGLGSYLTIGMSLDDQASADTVHAAFDAGINFIDTADAYHHGNAESCLGRLLNTVRRETIVIATKCHSAMSDDTNDRGLSHKHIRESITQSLRRLQTDYVDLYQCHRPDPRTPLTETVRAMDELSREGKILYWGVSEWPAWMIAEACAIAEQNSWRKPVSNQPRYSLYWRKPEMELFQYCRHAGIGNVVFSPLAHGMLAGKYKPGEKPHEGTRAADPKQNMVINHMYWEPRKLEQSQEFTAIARDFGCEPVQLALAWVLRRSEVSSAIIGASKVSQIEQNVKAVEVKLTEDVEQKLDALFTPPGENYPA